MGLTHVLFEVFLFLLSWRLGLVDFDLVLGFGFVVTFGLFVGHLGHLFLDSLTVKGVAWLLPFSRKRVRFLIGTGSMIERISFCIGCFFGRLGFPLVFEMFDMFSVLSL